MENHHAINGTTHYFNGHFQVRKLWMFTRGYGYLLTQPAIYILLYIKKSTFFNKTIFKGDPARWGRWSFSEAQSWVMGIFFGQELGCDMDLNNLPMKKCIKIIKNSQNFSKTFKTGRQLVNHPAMASKRQSYAQGIAAGFSSFQEGFSLLHAVSLE